MVTATESAGALFISQQDCLLATDSRFELQAQHEASHFKIFCYREGLAKNLSEILSRLDTKKLGFENNRLSVGQYNKMKEQLLSNSVSVDLIETEDIVENLRVVKSGDEIRKIQQALSIAETAFKNFIAIVRPGMTEKEAAWELEKNLREAGADGLSFPTIAASGPNSALPHAIPGDRRFQKGEPILFDWGVKLNGYCSDISRTVCIGESDDRFKRVFETVLEAQQRAIEAIHPGSSTKHVDNIARTYIDENGFKSKFGHSLGHGAGLAVHEYPRISPHYDQPLEAGMVFTIEPGIYISDWGGVRLENMVVVSEEDPVVLNTLNPEDYLIEV